MAHCGECARQRVMVLGQAPSSSRSSSWVPTIVMAVIGVGVIYFMLHPEKL